jgi:hypothetical protein
LIKHSLPQPTSYHDIVQRNHIHYPQPLFTTPHTSYDPSFPRAGSGYDHRQRSRHTINNTTRHNNKNRLATDYDKTRRVTFTPTGTSPLDLLR